MEEKYVTIVCSSDNKIDDYYKSVARSVANYLAKEEYNLVFGGCSTSMMGICYDEFSKHNRKIIAVTTDKYKEDLVNLKINTEPIICKSTFDEKKEMFERSNLIVVLPGGIGTLSEMLAFIEENRSNDQKKHIEVYNENHYYDSIIDILGQMVNEKFIDIEVFNHFNISSNKEEFINHILDFEYKNKERLR